jgi:uncharacterized protein YdeI (YjbR/CyaY-like superfamily)
MPKTSKTRTAPAPKRFDATLVRMRSRLNWVVIHVPFDAGKIWGLRGQIKVKGEINGFLFRTTLFPTRATSPAEGRHIMVVNKRMQKEARAVEGSVAHFQLELDKEERTVTTPKELQRFLGGSSSEERTLRRWYDKLTPSARSEIAWWVGDPKTAEARARRAEQMAERLFAVMDAESELPPILQVVFARNPQAGEGWEGMSVARRRGHLFGIFYYRTPDAQARRIEKMLADATALAEKIRRKRKTE